MYTFNLGLVFGQAESVVIIVCSSDSPIDKEKVNRVATKHFQIGLSRFRQAKDLIDHMVDGIRAECGINAVMVTADCACHIPKKPN